MLESGSALRVVPICPTPVASLPVSDVALGRPMASALASRRRNRTPILVDDVISTGHTMLEAVGHLRAVGSRPPVCVGVHAVFAGDAYAALLRAGVARVVTTTIPHASNAIDVSARIAASAAAMVESKRRD